MPKQTAVAEAILLTDLYAELELPKSAAEVFEDIPEEGDFKGEYIAAEAQLRPYFNALVDRFPDVFYHLAEAETRLFWKSKGGGSGGNDTLGKCVKPSGFVEYYSDANYIIWLAADHLRTRRFTHWQILALLYHEMRHTVIDDKGKYGTQGHQFEGFYDELEIFGGWLSNREEIIRAAKTVGQQPRLFED